MNPIGVDIIVPMFNEEKVILDTIEALNKIKYSNYTIILIDDGSTDGTLALIRQHYGNYPNIKILSQPNKGKAAALNRAIENSYNDIIVCIDADTLIESDLIEKLLPYFEDSQVAAVAGNIKVCNRNNLITNVQAVEYTTLYNYDRKLFESVDGILIIPGALGAFKREIVLSLGGYRSDTLAEDTELTLRILCNNYKIRNATDLVGYTETPASLKMFLKQRIRWKVGTFQVLKNYPFSHQNKVLSYIIIPYAWIFGMILPIVTPLIDIMFFYQVFFKRDFSTVNLYLSFILIDSVICSVIILLMKENPFQILFIVFQRFILRQLSLFTYVAIIIKAITGKLFKWDKITRYGNSKAATIRALAEMQEK
ncbi:glycosyltransferase family 2 protein [Pedobacter sp. MR22-3]|uniref:glycosyltransferase family 2 protein n=1 Tax=Pedobacter TaxID=84567 RepID=UPI002245BD3F|nr:glycosyltransferase family 2 protein [Pedobacter sp. MR22-3]MCX2584729.1 glycosyltransferase family 2 protein [Pedobacter sp. MR22-3]